MCVECGSDYDSLQWLDTSSETLNGASSTPDHAMNSSAAINDNLLNSERQFRRDGYDSLPAEMLNWQLHSDIGESAIWWTPVGHTDVAEKIPVSRTPKFNCLFFPVVRHSPSWNFLEIWLRLHWCHWDSRKERMLFKVQWLPHAGFVVLSIVTTLWVKKKGATLSMAITLSIFDRFAKFFHCCKEQ